MDSEHRIFFPSACCRFRGLLALYFGTRLLPEARYPWLAIRAPSAMPSWSRQLAKTKLPPIIALRGFEPLESSDLLPIASSAPRQSTAIGPPSLPSRIPRFSHALVCHISIFVHGESSRAGDSATYYQSGGSVHFLTLTSGKSARHRECDRETLLCLHEDGRLRRCSPQISKAASAGTGKESIRRLPVRQ
jgi:hypothetical protein